MPELPEVETIKRGLTGPLVGKRVTSVQVFRPTCVHTSLTHLKKHLPGKKILTLDRRGKYLIFHLSGDHYLLLHLKMSGSLWVLPAEEPLHRHVRAVFGLHNGMELRFKDMRTFGRIYLVRDTQQVIGTLGPEPLDPRLTLKKWLSLFEKRRARLKPLLLNQQFIAGIGNIYADEACFRAGVHPATTVDSLTLKQLKSLYHAVREVLSLGILHHGAGFDEVYRGGEFQNYFNVYGRKGLPCRNCGTPIERIVLNSRSTHFCPHCQPLKKGRKKTVMRRAVKPPLRVKDSP